MTQRSLDSIRIIMVDTSHPGNIGGAARALKAMGLSQLNLVRPKKFPHADATARAAGADDMLATTKVFDDIDSAITGCGLVIAASARLRNLSWPVVTPREAASRAMAAAANNTQVAFLFGNEQSGLSNDELSRSHYHVQIPTDDNFSSLNLAAAIQVIVYELRMQTLQFDDQKVDTRDLATADDMKRLYDHLQDTLENVGYLDPENPGKLMHRLRRLFSRAQLEQDEIHILRGILRGIERESQ